jgi:hypothetical protein
MTDPVVPQQAWAVLLSLAKQLRGLKSQREAGFLLSNETRQLVNFRQSAVWTDLDGLYTLSGVVQIEANVPYAQWVSALFKHWHAQASESLGHSMANEERTNTGLKAFTALDLPAVLAAEWAAWWPAHALWVRYDSGAVMFVRDQAWSEPEQLLLREWLDIWSHEFNRNSQPRLKSPVRWMRSLKATHAPRSVVSWWQQPKVWGLLALTVTLLFPVRLTVLASGELTPANPAVIRAPLDGVIDVFHISPNQVVKKDQLLFGFDELLTQSRLDVAKQALSTAEAEYRQTVHQAMVDARARNQLSVLTGKIQEKRAEVDFLVGQLGRTRVLAPQAGFVLMDEPSEWIGRPVTVGERILRIASPDDIEIEAWLALSDAIALGEGAELSLFLNANPLQAVKAKIRYVAHDAVQRPDGVFAYRVRAVLVEKTSHRVGLKGTAKIYGDWVPLVYWMMRRPVASARAYLGI